MDNFESQYFTTKLIKAEGSGLSNHNIMIVMHGLGDQLDSYVPLVKEIHLTGINYLLINAPRNYPIGYSWYEMPPEAPRQSINESLDLLKKLIQELREQNFSYEDIFVMGFSQGGAMALELVNALDKTLGGVLALSPRVYLDTDQISQGLRSTPFYSSHGLYDDVIPFKETQASLLQMKPQIKDFFFSEHEMGHEICFEEILEIRNWLNERI